MSKKPATTSRIAHSGWQDSIIMSLPLDWVRKHEIKKGDTLLVKEVGSSLVIIPLKLN